MKTALREGQFCLVMPNELKRALFQRAAAEDRSAGSVARRALRSYLGEPKQNGATITSTP